MNKTQKVSAGILSIIIVIFFIVGILNQANRNIQRFNDSKYFTTSDFQENNYEVTEIWEREFTYKNASTLDQKYIFFKVKGQPFNFNFGEEFTDYGQDKNNIKSILTYLKPGASVSILANKEDIRYASNQSLIRRASNFFAGLNNEVEVYKLSMGGKLYVNRNINKPSLANRNFADIATTSNLLRLGFFCCLIYAVIYWLSRLIKKIKA